MLEQGKITDCHIQVNNSSSTLHHQKFRTPTKYPQISKVSPFHLTQINILQNNGTRLQSQPENLDQEQMGGGRSQHIDPMHRRLTLHLQHLLPSPKIYPELRPIHARYDILVQRRRGQRRAPVRAPLLRRRRPLRAVGRAPGGGGAVLRRLLLDVAGGHRGAAAAGAGGDVFVYVGGGARDDFLQHGECGHRGA